MVIGAHCCQSAGVLRETFGRDTTVRSNTAALKKNEVLKELGARLDVSSEDELKMNGSLEKTAEDGSRRTWIAFG